MPTGGGTYSNKQAMSPQKNRGSGPTRTWFAALLSIGGVTALGLLHLPYPFHGDQSLFLLMAEQLDRGAVLYRDTWDGKQPGIFIFYLAARRTFGFKEIGVHSFELTSWLVFAITILFALNGRIRTPLALGLAPVLIVGTYYLGSRPSHLTQIEILVGFPLFLAAFELGFHLRSLGALSFGPSLQPLSHGKRVAGKRRTGKMTLPNRALPR